MVICGGTIRLRPLVRGKYIFPDCSGAATGDGVEVNLHTPRYIWCLVWGTCIQIVQVLQSRGWLRSVHDNMGVDGDGMVHFDMIHAWEMRCLDSASSLIWAGGSSTNFEGRLWSSMQNPCTERCDVGLLSCFVFDMGWRRQDKL